MLSLNDGELVAADARDRVDVADGIAQSAGDDFQQFVAHMMPERVVDALELVETDVEHREPLSARLFR